MDKVKELSRTKSVSARVPVQGGQEYPPLLQKFQVSLALHTEVTAAISSSLGPPCWAQVTSVYRVGSRDHSLQPADF